ncbi:MAG: glycosyltransferase family 2 protein [Ilumatobacteraceae bacterium]
MTPLPASDRSSLPSIAVVVCAYTENRWDELVACVEALRNQTVPPAEQFVVIDHNEALFSRARAEFTELTVLENAGDQGLAGARNTGIAAATADVVAFVDEDATPALDWIERMAANFADDDVLGVGGPIEPMWLGGRPAWFPDEFLWIVGCTYRGLPTETAAIGT